MPSHLLGNTVPFPPHELDVDRRVLGRVAGYGDLASQSWTLGESRQRDAILRIVEEGGAGVIAAGSLLGPAALDLLRRRQRVARETGDGVRRRTDAV